MDRALSKAEWRVMKVVWQKQPCSALHVIAQLSSSSPWGPATIKTLLSRLLRKGALRFRKIGKAYLYSPVWSEEQCRAQEAESFLDRVFNGSLSPMLAHFVQSRHLSEKEFEELERILKGKKMSATVLLDLTLRGSGVFLAVWLLDRLTGPQMRARWRRVWWALVPLAFLMPLRLPVTDHSVAAPVQHVFQHYVTKNITPWVTSWATVPQGSSQGSVQPAIALLWRLGLEFSLIWITILTWRVHRQWSRERFSTDPVLVNLLEDCRQVAGVTAPMGLVVSNRIAAPALLGWLRPRILLPTPFVKSASPQEIRAVLFHELAHFKRLDIPMRWLFTLVRAVHWFNPLSHAAMAAWVRFSEEAADEDAIGWMNGPGSTAYGEILLKTLGSCPPSVAPYGAFAIGETITNLKRRVLMIRNYSSKTSRPWTALTIIVLLGALLAFSPTWAQNSDAATAKTEAVAAMQPWLAEIDSGDYAKSWTDAAKSFQKAVTSDQWAAAATSVRSPLGKLDARKMVSAMYQTSIPLGGGKTLQGEYVIAQFDASFENLKYAIETVTFEKEADGAWRASGYFIKPR